MVVGLAGPLGLLVVPTASITVVGPVPIPPLLMGANTAQGETARPATAPAECVRVRTSSPV